MKTEDTHTGQPEESWEEEFDTIYDLDAPISPINNVLHNDVKQFIRKTIQWARESERRRIKEKLEMILMPYITADGQGNNILVSGLTLEKLLDSLTEQKE